MASETTVGGIVGTLRMDADQFHREIERAIAEVDHLEGKKVNIQVDADTARAEAGLSAVREKAERLDGTNVRLSKSTQDTGRGMRALTAAILTVGPAIVPLAVATVGLAAGFGAMGTAGVFAIVGIRHEMEQGTATGRAYSGAIQTLKADVEQLGQVAAGGVLGPFQAAVADLQPQMSNLTRIVGDFSVITGKTAGNLTTGLIASFVALEPLMRDVGVYTYGLSQRFREMMTGPGVVSFGDYVRSVFPQVMQAVEALVGAAIHLVSALAPLGLGILSAIGALSSVISSIPVDVLATLATTASSVFLGFKSYGLVAGLITGVSSALVKMGVSAGVAAAGMAALNIAAAGIGAIVAVATFLYTRHADAVRKDQQAVDDYTDALRRSNGVIDENVRQKAFQILSDNGAYDAAKRLGIGLNLVTDAALGNVSASRELGRQMQAAAAAQNDFEAGGRATGRSAGETNQALSVLNQTVGTNTRQLSDAQRAQKDWAEASKTSTVAATDQDRAQAALAGRLGTTVTALQAATTSQQQTASSTAAATLQMQMENDAAGILKQSLDLLNGKAISAAEAQNAFDSSLANMGDHVDKTGKQITFTTTSIGNMSAASVALRGQLNGQVSNLQRVVEANGGLANSTGKARAQMVTMRQQIIDNAVAHGVDRKAVTTYIDKLLAIPKKVPPTKLDIDKAQAIADLKTFQTAVNSLTGKTVQIYATAHIATVREAGNAALANAMNTANQYATGHAYGSGSSKDSHGSTKGARGGLINDGVRGFAGGGLLVGPGSGTSDSILAAISGTQEMIRVANGEFISTDASRRRNHAALEAGNRGATLSAEGGGIDYQQLAAALTAAMSRVGIHTTVSAGSFDRAMGAGFR